MFGASFKLNLPLLNTKKPYLIIHQTNGTPYYFPSKPTQFYFECATLSLDDNNETRNNRLKSITTMKIKDLSNTKARCFDNH